MVTGTHEKKERETESTGRKTWNQIIFQREQKAKGRGGGSGERGGGALHQQLDSNIGYKRLFHICNHINSGNGVLIMMLG